MDSCCCCCCFFSFFKEHMAILTALLQLHTAIEAPFETWQEGGEELQPLVLMWCNDMHGKYSNNPSPDLCWLVCFCFGWDTSISQASCVFSTMTGINCSSSSPFHTTMLRAVFEIMVRYGGDVFIHRFKSNNFQQKLANERIQVKHPQVTFRNVSHPTSPLFPKSRHILKFNSTIFLMTLSSLLWETLFPIH